MRARKAIKPAHAPQVLLEHTKWYDAIPEGAIFVARKWPSTMYGQTTVLEFVGKV